MRCVTKQLVGLHTSFICNEVLLFQPRELPFSKAPTRRGIYFGNIPDYLNAYPLECLIFAIIVRKLPGTQGEQRQ